MITSESDWKKHVEDITGNSNGGTCHRPDIRVSTGFCDGCEYVEYCLVTTKKLLKSKTRRRRKK
jgi:hypothetical protein